VTVPSTINAAAWLGKYLESDDGDTDLARAMLQAFAETLMSAEASATCGAAYNERNEERTNSRNGYPASPLGYPGRLDSTWLCRNYAKAAISPTGCSRPAGGPNKPWWR